CLPPVDPLCDVVVAGVRGRPEVEGSAEEDPSTGELPVPAPAGEYGLLAEEGGRRWRGRDHCPATTAAATAATATATAATATTAPPPPAPPPAPHPPPPRPHRRQRCSRAGTARR